MSDQTARSTPGGPVTVRVAATPELDGVGQLTVHAYLAAGVVRANDPYLAVLADAAGRATDACLLVATGPDGGIVGTVTTARHGRPYADLARPGETEVRMLAVAPSAQRSGVASALLRGCADRARADGDGALVISVTSTNAAALAFYRRLGFVRRPDRDRVLSETLTLVTLTAGVGSAGP